MNLTTQKHNALLRHRFIIRSESKRALRRSHSPRRLLNASPALYFLALHPIEIFEITPLAVKSYAYGVTRSNLAYCSNKYVDIIFDNDTRSVKNILSRFPVRHKNLLVHLMIPLRSVPRETASIRTPYYASGFKKKKIYQRTIRACIGRVNKTTYATVTTFRGGRWDGGEVLRLIKKLFVSRTGDLYRCIVPKAIIIIFDYYSFHAGKSIVWISADHSSCYVHSHPQI